MSGLQTDVAEGVHRLEDAFVNLYLVEDGGVTVVDAGHPATWSRLLSALGRIGRRPQDVEAVVLTHGHFDHVGFAERARRRLGVPVMVHDADAPLTRHPWRYDHERPRTPYLFRHPSFGRVLAAMTAAGAPIVSGVQEVRTYGGGETLDVPGRPTVIPTPGHTHGHCSLSLPERGVVIAGDAIVTHDPYTGATGPRIVSGAATADSGRALASIGALAELDADVLLPGHGSPWRGDPAEAVARAREAGPG